MGKYEKKPRNQINWPQSIVDSILGLLIGIILLIIEWALKK